MNTTGIKRGVTGASAWSQGLTTSPTWAPTRQPCEHGAPHRCFTGAGGKCLQDTTAAEGWVCACEDGYARPSSAVTVRMQRSHWVVLDRLTQVPTSALDQIMIDDGVNV